MKIELTQGEIKQAIAEYVSGVMGVDLNKNELAIAFSATRLSGTIAFLEITPKNPVVSYTENAPASTTIPGYTTDQPDVTAVDSPALAEPAADPATPEVAAAKEADATLGDPVQAAETVVTPATTDEPVLVATADPDAEPDADAAPAPKATTATLFGKPTPTAAG